MNQTLRKSASEIQMFFKWEAHANKHAKEKKEEKNTTFSANFYGALLKHPSAS